MRITLCGVLDSSSTPQSLTPHQRAFGYDGAVLVEYNYTAHSNLAQHNAEICQREVAN